MLYRKFLLLALGCMLIYAGYKSPYGKYWLNTYILVEGNSFTDQWDKTSVEEREAFRYGNLYILSNLIKNTLHKNNINTDTVLVLFPPTKYLIARNVTVFSMPDPSSFYCLTRIRSVWTTSPDVRKANWVVLPGAKNSLTFVPVTNDYDRNRVLDSFSKYTPSL